ncbi:MAG: hypothetical protein WBO10_09950 [Pyrinomonadaceae bacterium]
MKTRRPTTLRERLQPAPKGRHIYSPRISDLFPILPFALANGRGLTELISGL